MIRCPKEKIHQFSAERPIGTHQPHTCGATADGPHEKLNWHVRRGSAGRVLPSPVFRRRLWQLRRRAAATTGVSKRSRGKMCPMALRREKYLARREAIGHDL